MKLLNYTSEEKENLYKIGIYKISFKNDKKNRVYIGSALIHKNRKNHRGFYHRWTRHLEDLTANKHANCKLQNAFNKYGIENLRFEIVEILKPGQPSSYYEEIETEYIKKYDAVKNGWNININGRNCIGTPMREEVKKKISIANSGKNNGMYGKFNEKNPTSKKVYQYDLEGNFVKEWASAREIYRNLNIHYKQISQAFKTTSKYCKGYLWHNINMGDKIQKYTPYDKIKNLKLNK